ncbi:MAG: CARDB domain-containing protein [Planctomycetota bacterium]|nr:CARDB domain-containing protein [Planctomycetota bacterium]
MTRLRRLLIPALALATALIPLPTAQAAPPDVAAPRDSGGATPHWTPPLLLPNLTPARADISKYPAPSPFDKEVEFVKAQLWVLNTGTWYATSFDYRVEVRMDGVLLWSWESHFFPWIQPGAAKPIQVVGFAKAKDRTATYEVRVILDSRNHVIEGSETDNVVVMTKTL